METGELDPSSPNLVKLERGLKGSRGRGNTLPLQERPFHVKECPSLTRPGVKTEMASPQVRHHRLAQLGQQRTALLSATGGKAEGPQFQG